MKIGIIERFDHRSVLEYLVNILSSNNEVYVMTNQLNCNRLLPYSISCYNIENYTKTELLLRIEKEETDIIIACTITPTTKPWKQILDLDIPRVALIHNVHWQLSEKLLWRKNYLISLARRIRWWFKGELAARLKLTYKLDGLVFPSPDIKEYAKRFTDIPSLGIQWAIAPECIKEHIPSGKLRLCLPGGIDFNYRDYKMLIEALKICNPKIMFYVDFLGIATTQYDKTKLNSLLTDSPSNIVYQTYDKYVENEIFHDAITSCDLIVINHKGKVYFAEQLEYGGRTKISGSENDQVMAAKPALVSVKYIGMKHLEDNQKIYNNTNELKVLLEQAAEDSWTFKVNSHNTRAFQEEAWQNFLINIQTRFNRHH